jgi:ribosomal-protein-alanine N-acetyltransferase
MQNWPGTRVQLNNTQPYWIDHLDGDEDLDGVLFVESESFTNPWTREMYLAEFDNRGVSFCYVAKNDRNKIVGFCSFWRVVDELHINNLAVAPDFRRAGVATALLERVLSDARSLGTASATLEVRRSNEAARELYQRFGFSIAGVRRAYYTKPVEDAIVLRLGNLIS